MKTLLRISGWIDAFNERLGRAVCWLTLAMVLVASYNAIARYLGKLFHANLTSNALVETQWYLFSIVFLLGAAYTLKHNAHVRVDVLYDRLGLRARAWINVLGGLLFLVPFCIFLLWTAWRPVVSSCKILETSPDPGGLPRYPIKALLIVAVVFILLQGLAEIVKQIAVLRGHQLDEAEEEVGAI
jgi:TRAP-type mannitol/chloroaromatic compound transport system permease small subunit